MVGLSQPDDAAAVRAFAQGAGATVRCWRPLCVLEFAGSPPLDRLRALPGVRYAERDRPLRAGPRDARVDRAATAAPPPPADIDGTLDCPDLWELEAIGVAAAWAAVGSRGAAAPVVAIQDSGFLLTHRDLGAVSGQFDYGDVDTVPEVSWSAGVPGHGTFIAGLISARDDNGLARVGVLPEGGLNLQKIADSSGALYFSYAVAAMLDLADGDLGVRVLNYSIASSSTTASFDDAIAALGDAGVLLVAAAGNCAVADCSDADNDRWPLYPANSPGEHVLSVAGSTRTDGLNPYSHYGASTVDLAAPGVDLCSLDVGSDTDTAVAAGTSYAAPLVAATAALVWEAWPRLTPGEVARILRASATPSAALASRVRAGGRLSAEGAVQTALVTLDAPARLTVEGRADLVLDLDSRAAAGEADVLLVHGDGVAVSAAPAGWTATAYAAGEAVPLPDAGRHVLSRAATVLSGPLAADTTGSVGVELVGRVEGVHGATLRLVATSAGADWLNAPYDTGATDETGFLALDLDLEVTAAEGSDGGSDGGDAADGSDGSDGSDGTDGLDGSDDRAGSSADGGDDPAGCATAVPAPGALALLPLVSLLVGARRRQLA